MIYLFKLVLSIVLFAAFSAVMLQGTKSNPDFKKDSSVILYPDTSQRESSNQRVHTPKNIVVFNDAQQNESEGWIVKHLLPGIVSLFVAIVSFFLSQMYFRRKERIKKQEEYLSILKVVAEEVKTNLNFECQLHAYLFVNLLPTFSLSFFVSEYLFKDLTRLSSNYPLLRDIFHKYFEYRHIQDRIDRTKLRGDELERATRPNVENGFNEIMEHSKYRERYESERDGTLELLKGNIQGSLELYNQIAEELNKLSRRKEFVTLPLEYLDEKYNEFQNDHDVLSGAIKNKIDLSLRPKYRL